MKKNTMVKKRLVLKSGVKNFINRMLVTGLIFIIGMILVKSNPKYKNTIISEVYEKSFKFTKIGSLYKKYFGKVFSVDELVNAKEKSVFNEELVYKKDNTYKDGVKLTVSHGYMVPILKDGIVVYMGEKEGYGNTVGVEQVDGIVTYYSNITPVDIKLYDYVKKGNVLGEVLNDKLYLTFQKEGKYLDYKKYI